MHADTIDPKLDDLLNSNEGSAGGFASLPHLLPPGAGLDDNGANGTAAATNPGLRAAAPAIEAALDIAHPSADGTNIQGWSVVSPGTHSDGIIHAAGAGPTQRVAPAAAAATAAAAAAPAAAAATAAAPDPAAAAAPVAAAAAPVPAAPAAAAAAAAQGGAAPTVGDTGAGGSLPGSSLVPSDPVLAMQMGARLALTGEAALTAGGPMLYRLKQCRYPIQQCR